MGIFIYLEISKSVTKEEWEKVYEETLLLAKNLPLAERRQVKIHGINAVCLAPVREGEEIYGWHNEKVRIGWGASGDYIYMKTAEEYYLPRNLIGDNMTEPSVGDALYGVLPECLDYDWEDERYSHVYSLWDSKTQGEPYHIYLLAVVALIESRLGKKAFVHGDVTRGQFRKAVRIANQYLDRKIEMPDRCDMDRFLKRVSGLSLTDDEQLEVFVKFYLGTKDAEFGSFMRQRFSEEAVCAYWKRRFENTDVGTLGFDSIFNEYMLWGFELEKLCDYEDLKFYKAGDTMHPVLTKSVGHSRKFLDSLLNENEFRELMAKDAHQRCEWIAEQMQE